MNTPQEESRADREEGTEIPDSVGGALIQLLHPVPFIALIIILGVFALIGSSLFDLKNDVLSQMSRPDYTRGLITYLFAVVTIGTAVVLVVSALISPVKNDQKFQRGKDILGLLLGVFGTIVGYYFGAEQGQTLGPVGAALSLTAPQVAPAPATSGQISIVQARAQGGSPPYRYAVYLEDGEEPLAEGRAADGRIVTEVLVPQLEQDSTITLRLTVIDAQGDSATTLAGLRVRPAREDTQSSEGG